MRDVTDAKPCGEVQQLQGDMQAFQTKLDALVEQIIDHCVEHGVVVALCGGLAIEKHSSVAGRTFERTLEARDEDPRPLAPGEVCMATSLNVVSVAMALEGVRAVAKNHDMGWLVEGLDMLIVGVSRQVARDNQAAEASHAARSALS